MSDPTTAGPDAAEPAGAPAAGGPITVSESAAKRIAFLRDQEGNPDVMLRVTVLGGGCSGFQYNFEFDTQSGDDDVRVERGDITVVTDSMSLLYLAGSEIDYVEDLIGAAFSIRNPNATAECSCGNSFTVG